MTKEDIDPIDTAYEDEITCPYCWHVFQDSRELGDWWTTDCVDCDKEFEYWRNVEVTYSTRVIRYTRLFYFIIDM